MIDLHILLGAIVEANIVLIALYLLYIGVFKRQHNYSYARFYLLSSVWVAIAIAATNIDVSWGRVFVMDNGITELSQLFPMAYNGIDPYMENPSQHAAPSFFSSWPTWVWAAMLIGSACSLLTFAIRWFVLHRKLQRTSHYDNHRDIFITDKFDAAFAYLNKVYIPRSYFSLPDVDLDLIIAHERGHIRSFHPVDRILFALFKSLFCYNPALYKLERELFAVHEYQIDEQLTDQLNNPSTYSSLLIKLQTKTFLPSIVTQFSMQLIKSRVHRLHQTNTSKMKKVIFLLALPVVAGLFYAFSVQLVPEQVQKTNSWTAEVAEERPFMLPIEAAHVKSYNPFGLRVSPFASSPDHREHHKGIDLVAPQGTPILAAAAGVVEIIEISDDGYGNNISLRHDDGSLTRYAHLDKVLIENKTRIEKGEQIGTCGSTGKSTGPHLHFELWIENEAVNPENHLDLSTIDIASLPGISKKKMVVIIDAGHGGEDPGQQVLEVNEKDITASIASQLSAALGKEGIQVIETREGDDFVALKDRISATDRKYAIFISLHANAADSSNARGVEMYIPNSDHPYYAQSRALGNQFSQAFNEANVINRGMKTASFYVLENSDCPSILLELGFLTNKLDREALLSEKYQKMIAEEISSSITAYAR